MNEDEGALAALPSQIPADQAVGVLAAVLELVPDAVVGASVDGRVTIWNAAAHRLFGYAADEIRGEPIAILWPEGERVEADVVLRSTLRHALVRGACVRRRRKDGRIIDVRLSVASLGPGLERIAVMQDMAESKRLEETLERTEERLRLIADNVTDLLWQYDVREGRFVYVNPASYAVLGYTPEEMQALAWEALLSEDRRDEVRQRISASFHPPKPGESPRSSLRLDLAQRHRDGHLVPCEIRATTLWEAGVPATVFGTTRDVSDQLRDGAERARLRNELEQAQKMEAMGLLAGGVAHDFNNQLAVICSAGEELLRELDPSHPVYEEAAEIVEAGRRSAALTRQLLAFSRRQVTSPEELDVGALVGGLEKMARRLIGEQVVLEVDLSVDPCWVRADPGQIEQALVNLVVNARDAMPDGGLLRIVTAPEGEVVVIRVSDTGTGMDDATLRRVFEPFFTTKERGKGTGLGLSVVHGIVAQSGGSIAATSEPGRGTCFEIRLPRLLDAPTARPDRIRRHAPEGLRGGETILVVDDDDAVRRVVMRTLGRHGYHVLAASEGGHAGLLAVRHPGEIDLLLTDVVMPHMYGPELAEKFRSARPNGAVVYMTGYVDAALERHANELETAAVLRKPFDAMGLLVAVRHALDARDPRPL